MQMWMRHYHKIALFMGFQIPKEDKATHFERKEIFKPN